MTRAAWALAALGALAGCERAVDGPRSAREAMAQWARCSFDGLGDYPTAGQVEGSMRQSLRRDRAQWVVRAGRCEDALAVGPTTPACLAGLRARWSQMLPVAQRGVDDAIETDVAVRRVGEAWTLALRDCH